MSGESDKTVVQPSGVGQQPSTPASITSPTVVAGAMTQMTGGGSNLTRLIIAPTIPDVELQGEIGRGGMGMVWRGRQTYLDRQVAVKLLLIDPGNGGDEYVRRFQREARILAGLSHPHICGCYQAGLTPEGLPYLVMEFIDGPNLRDWVAKHGPLSVPDALTLIRDLAEALGHAQESSIIHRDIKPENVLLAKPKNDASASSGQAPWIAKLVDLGLARPSAKGAGTTDMHLTMQGVVMGTPSTMAPEQFGDPDHVDFRADIYGLGCVLFHALTGKPAFASTSLGEILTAKVSGPVPDPQATRAELPPQISALVRWMLARDPKERPASYQALIDRCELLLAGRTPIQSRLLPKVAVALLVLLAGTYFLFYGKKQLPAPPPAAPTAVTPASATPTAGPPVPAQQQPQVMYSETDPSRLVASGPAQVLSGPPRPMDGWTLVANSAYAGAEDHDDAISGSQGLVTHPLPSGAYRITATVRMGKASRIGVGVVNSANITTLVAISNLGEKWGIGIDSGLFTDADHWSLDFGLSTTQPADEKKIQITIANQLMFAKVDNLSLPMQRLPDVPDRLVLFTQDANDNPPQFAAITLQMLK